MCIFYGIYSWSRVILTRVHMFLISEDNVGVLTTQWSIEISTRILLIIALFPFQKGPPSPHRPSVRHIRGRSWYPGLRPGALAGEGTAGAVRLQGPSPEVTLYATRALQADSGANCHRAGVPPRQRAHPYGALAGYAGGKGIIPICAGFPVVLTFCKSIWIWKVVFWARKCPWTLCFCLWNHDEVHINMYMKVIFSVIINMLLPYMKCNDS